MVSNYSQQILTDFCHETGDVLGAGSKNVGSAHLFGLDDLLAVMTNACQTWGIIQ